MYEAPQLQKNYNLLIFNSIIIRRGDRELNEGDEIRDGSLSVHCGQRRTAFCEQEDNAACTL